MSSAVKKEIDDAEGVAEEAFKIPGAVKRNLIVGLLLIGITAFSLYSRYVVMHHANGIAHHARLYATMINVAWDLLMTTSIILIAIVEEIWQVVRGIIRLFEGQKADIRNKFGVLNRRNLQQYLSPVKASDLANAASDLPARCAEYNNAYVILQGMIRPFADPTICPVVRWTYPSRWLWQVTSGALGWLTYGAKPPGDLGSCIDCTAPNCNTNTTGLTDTLCVNLGIGYVLAEIVIPLFLLQLVWPVIWKGIKTSAEFSSAMIAQVTMPAKS